MPKQSLRRLRLIEGLSGNITLLAGVLLFWVMPLYLGLSARVIISLIFVLFICTFKLTQSLKGFLYVRLLPFMKPLWDYDQQKLIPDKSRYKDRVLILIVIIGYIFVMVYPPAIPEPIDWKLVKYSVLGGLIGLNIGVVLKIFTEKFD